VGDLNGDNRINSTDLTLMKRYILKSIEDLPVEDDLWAAGHKRRRQNKFHRLYIPKEVSASSHSGAAEKIVKLSLSRTMINLKYRVNPAKFSAGFFYLL